MPLLVALTAVALVGCSGGDEEAAAPVPLAQRFLTAGDAPGSKTDPVEKRQTTADFDGFISTLSERSIDPDREDMTKLFQEAGFKQAGADTRFFGEAHAQTAPHAVSGFIELQSEEGATSALDWLESDALKPCPMSCAAQISTFDVDDIGNALGVRRLSTAKDIERVGNPDERPHESYWVGFTEGRFVHMLDLHGPPGSVSEEQAQTIARAYHDRLTGN